MSAFTGLPADYFKFFTELSANNNREWFNDNKDRFRASVQEPLAAFVEAMAPRLKKISKHFVADPRLNGGSVFRIYKDVRFESGTKTRLDTSSRRLCNGESPMIASFQDIIERKESSSQPCS